MYKEGTYIIYRKDVCLIKHIRKNDKNEEYYVLSPLRDSSLIVSVPIEDHYHLLRPLLTPEEVKSLIQEIPMIPIIEVNDRMIENEYRNLLNSNDPKNLIRIIKTTYLRNKERLDHNKKIAEKDHEYFKKAEEYLYYELGTVLGMSFDQTKQYVIDMVFSLEKQS